MGCRWRWFCRCTLKVIHTQPGTGIDSDLDSGEPRSTFSEGICILQQARLRFANVQFRFCVGGGPKIGRTRVRVQTNRLEEALESRGPNCCRLGGSRCERRFEAVARTCRTTRHATPGAPQKLAPGDFGLGHRRGRSHHTSPQPTPKRCQPYPARHRGWLRPAESPPWACAPHSL